MMSKEEAEKANVTDDRRRYLHVCSDKVNMAPPPDAERAGRRNGRQRRRLIAVAMAGCLLKVGFSTSRHALFSRWEAAGSRRAPKNNTPLAQRCFRCGSPARRG